MINLWKSQPPPQSLSEEKHKVSGTYRTQEVIERLSQDFFGKCYICGHNSLTSVNVEHFVPHRGDVDLKFDWENLFWACAHCNNTKHARSEFDPILKCTDWNDQIVASIRFEFNAWPKERPQFVPLVDDDRVRNTAALLDAVFNGHTTIKQIESNALRGFLLKEITEFRQQLIAFYDEATPPAEREVARGRIEHHLAASSPFCAFKIWAVLRLGLDRDLGHAYRAHQPMDDKYA